MFRTWLRKARPDVILTLHSFVRELVNDAGLRIPENVGLIQLERRASHADWAGMDQHNDQTGAAAVDMLLGMLHHQEFGVPSFVKATLIGASWVAGNTVRSRV